MTDAAEQTITQVGPYRLEEQLGAGGMGRVFRAFDERLERWVALKQILPDVASNARARKRFLREARAAARLNHPAIVQIHDILDVDDCDWIVMELVDGDVLDDLITRGPLSADRAVALAVEIAGGLEAAHGEGIVHRDLKAKNVLVNTKGKIKILDFGLAKPIEAEEADASVSIVGQVVGTPRAMSPEQATGAEVDHRSDLFSLGTLLYEMTTGKSPFSAPGVMATVTRVCTHRQTPAHEVNPAVPEKLSQVIDRLLEKDPQHRPQTARDVTDSLRLLGSAVDLTSSSPSSSSPFRAPRGSGDTATYDGRPQLTTERQRATVERRQITVMSCELVDADEDSLGLDPETLVQVVPEFHALVSEAIAQFDGHLGSGLGHRLVVYFGYPQAHEDDARRAVRAALRILAEVGQLNDRTDLEQPARLALRIGIHTGLAVVMPDATGNEQVALGQTLEVANRVESLAVPNTVVVSPATHPLIEGFFVEEAMPPASLPGFSSPVPVHRVVAAHDIHTRVELAAPLLPLIGRQQELDLLLNRWQLARTGNGQVVLLSGEAGIGKSRLVFTLEQQLREDGAQWLMCYGSTYSQSSPLRPVIELLRRVLNLGDGDGAEQLERLEESLGQRDFELSEAMPLFAPLFGLAADDRYPPLPMSPEKQRSETMEAILALLLEMAEQQPLGLVMEDLHWMDPSTLELLGLLIDQASASPLLLLLTFRNEFEAPWGHRAYLTQLNLNRLVGDELHKLIDRVPGGKDLPADVRQQIVDKTDGVPLFVEELTKTVIESGLLDDQPGSSATFPALDIPATLRDSLTARLDRLGAAKDVAQLASVIGRGFRYELLVAVSTLEAVVLQHELERLVEAELVMRRGFGSRAQYVFKHALIQDAAYDSLLKGTRRKYHHKIAEALEFRFSESAENQPELLAHHYTKANVARKAIGFWQRAADLALGRSANLEALEHIQQGLTLVESLPDGAERWRMELTLQMSRGAVYVVSKGFPAPEMQETHARAYELCERLGDAPQLGWALRGLFFYYSARGDLDRSLALAEQLLRVAESQSDVALSMAARMNLGVSYQFLGDFAASREQFELGISLGTGEKTMVGDPGIPTRCHLAFVLWLQGYPDQALERIEEAVALARERSPSAPSPDLAWTLAWRVLIHHCRGDTDAVRELADEAVNCCQTLGIPIWLAQTQILLGSAILSQSGADSEEEGLGLIQRGLDAFRLAGARTWLPFLLSHWVSGQALLGRGDKESIDECLELIAATKESQWSAELHRLAGEVARIEDPDSGQAETWYHKALDVAREQQARSLELRAATSLARALAARGDRQEAHALLSEVVDWFEEGLDSGDFKTAKTLLDELS